MNLLLGYFLTAVNADPLIKMPMVECAVPFVKLLTVVGVELLMNLLMVAGIILLLSLEYFVEGREGVKVLLLRDGWLKGDERWLNGGSNAAKRGRSVSIKYEIVRIGDEFAGEDFQNIGAFIVVRYSVFSKSSAHKMHLARDAYHAY